MLSFGDMMAKKLMFQTSSKGMILKQLKVEKKCCKTACNEGLMNFWGDGPQLVARRLSEFSMIRRASGTGIVGWHGEVQVQVGWHMGCSR